MRDNCIHPEAATGQQLPSLLADEVLESCLPVRDTVSRVDFLLVHQLLPTPRASPLAALVPHQADTGEQLQAVLVEKLLRLSVQAFLHAGDAVGLQTIVQTLANGHGHGQDRCDREYLHDSSLSLFLERNEKSRFIYVYTYMYTYIYIYTYTCGLERQLLDENGRRIFPKPVPSVVKFRVVHPCNLFTLYIWRAPPLGAVRVTAPPCLFFLPICRGTGRVVTMLSRAPSVAARGPFNAGGPYRGKYSSEAGADRCSTTAYTAAHRTTCDLPTDNGYEAAGEKNLASSVPFHLSESILVESSE